MSRHEPADARSSADLVSSAPAASSISVDHADSRREVMTVRTMVLLLVGALLLAGCGMTVVGRGGMGSGDNMLDVFAFQEFCSQGNQGDGG
jgi:hypothetical protein